jgi:alkylation response protein AidB-like acyl-CoA dehydrogenase
VIGDCQGVSFQLADSAVETVAARCMAAVAARRIDLGRDALLQVDMAKSYAVEMCHRVFDCAIQVYGGMGSAASCGSTRLAPLAAPADGRRSAEILPPEHRSPRDPRP